jgi:integrase
MQEGFSQSRKLVKTSTPGIYKRSSRYVVVFRDPHGRQRKRAAKTLAEARELKATLTADVKRGEYRSLSKITFADYAADWIESYQGRTSRGIRPETLADYRADLERVAIPFFGRMQLAAIEPRDIKRLAAGLAETGLAPGSVRNLLAPVRVLLATAVEEGVIRSNPAAGLRITQRVEEDGAEGVKALTEDELRALLTALPDEWRLFFEFLTHTGLRIGEAIALSWGDVDVGRHRVNVRRRLYRGRFDAPKSRYGRRSIPLSEGLAQTLWPLRGTRADDVLVFSSSAGSPLNDSNLRARILKPAAVEAGLGEWAYAKGRRSAKTWVGFHTFRHTCATMLFRYGLNAKQVQMWLGHHSPAFTLARYVHLLPDDLTAPDFLDRLTEPSPDLRGVVHASQPRDQPAHIECRGVHRYDEGVPPKRGTQALTTPHFDQAP